MEQKRPSPCPIEKPNVLLVEGKDDYWFFQYFLKHFHIETIQVEDPVGGKDNLKNYLGLLKVAPGHEILQKIGIVRDSNENRAKAMKEVKSALKSSDFPVPDKPAQFKAGKPSVAVLILPPAGMEGRMLEDVCLESKKDEPAMKCVEEYMECVNKKGLRIKEKDVPKARVEALLASGRPGDLLGAAAQHGYWKYEHPAFEQIKTFLLSFNEWQETGGTKK